MVSTKIVAAVAAMAVSASAQNSDSCRKLKDIYANPKDMCELMWDNAFRYVPKEDPEYEFSYTMWFYGEDNPNDEITSKRITHEEFGDQHDGFNTTDVCHLDSLHKTHPTPEPDTFTECHPWRKASCCSDELDLSAETLNTLYGDQYRWDKCGQLSQACERFFVEEGCFYQCDANIGIFRKAHPSIYNPEEDSTHAWKVFGMPIKADYCDSWYAACAHDYFCVEDSKAFFSCPKDREIPLQSAEVVAIVLGVVAGIIFIGALYIVYREKSGQPIFIKSTNVKGLDDGEDNVTQA